MEKGPEMAMRFVMGAALFFGGGIGVTILTYKDISSPWMSVSIFMVIVGILLKMSVFLYAIKRKKNQRKTEHN